MLKGIAILSGLALAVPAFAQVTEIHASNHAPGGGNPNGKICERIEKTGSRLGATTVCMTAQEWSEQRRTQRNDVEAVQRVVNLTPADPNAAVTRCC